MYTSNHDTHPAITPCRLKTDGWWRSVTDISVYEVTSIAITWISLSINAKRQTLENVYRCHSRQKNDMLHPLIIAISNDSVSQKSWRIFLGARWTHCINSFDLGETQDEYVGVITISWRWWCLHVLTRVCMVFQELHVQICKYKAFNFRIH